LVFEQLAGLFGPDDPVAERVVVPDDPTHAILDLWKVLRRQGARQVEVVVEAVLESVVRRAPSEPGPGNISLTACAITWATEWRRL
jgi:hypothetical protein